MEEKTVQAIELLADAFADMTEEMRMIKKLLVIEHEMLEKLLEEKGENVVPFNQNLKHT